MRNILFVTACFFTTAVFGSDLAKEQRWADQVLDSLLDGEEVNLTAYGTDFIGIFTEAEQAQANVLLLHGIGAHPDWPQVISPLRVGLTELGFNTFSIQLPILANDAASEDYDKIMHEAAPRIKTAVAYLAACCKLKNHIVAHSMGAKMATSYLSNNSRPDINKFVAVGMNKDVNISKITVPVFDIYGEYDFAGVLEAIPQRKAETSKQVMIKGADHFMEGQEQELLELIADLLGQ